MLQEYAADPVGKWKSKDAAIYLVTSLAAKAQTQKVQFLSFSLTLHQLLAVSGHFSKDRENTLLDYLGKLYHKTSERE